MFHLGRQLRAGDLGEGGEKIEVSTQRIALHTGGDPTGGPAEKAWHPCAALIHRYLAPFHSGIVDFHPFGAAVVAGKVNDQGIVLDAPLLELREQVAKVSIDVFQHPKKLGCLFVDAGFAQIVLIVFLRHHMRTVCGVERDVGEERLFRPAPAIHPLDRLREKQVGAVTRGFLKLAVMPECRIDVRVAGCVATGAGVYLPDAATAVDIDFVKAAVLRAIGFLVAEMPFAENAGRVADRLEHLWQRESL